MTHLGRLRATLILLIGGLAIPLALQAEDPPAAEVPGAGSAVKPMTPEVPDSAVLALQSGRYAEAAEALAPLAADGERSADDRAFYQLIRGVALRLAKDLDGASAALKSGLESAPEGAWAAKLKSEQVAVALDRGDYERAESIGREEAERLLGEKRKDRLAQVYQNFAERLLDPDDPTEGVDPEGAYGLLTQARDLAQGKELRAKLLRQMGLASQKAGNPGRAVENFQAYLDEYPEGADRAEVRFALGEAQLAAGLLLPARLTWTDLARDLEKADPAGSNELRGRALFQVSRTYGLPSPQDETGLNLGVAALRRSLEADPDGPMAVQAAFEIATSYQARGHAEDALTAFRNFLNGEGFEASGDESARSYAELKMTAQFQVAAILNGQGQFDAAIAAWETYLVEFPNGPQSADAQRAIVDTRLAIAAEALRVENYDDAREAWSAFVARYPLDARVPQVLFQIGESYGRQERWDEAVAAWETLAGKFPGTEPAAHAEYQIALVLEEQKGKPAAAIERYQKIQVEPWASQARTRVAVMSTESLTVVTPRAFRSGETPTLEIDTRNLEKLTFTAYKLDAEAYFRKKQELEHVEALDVGLVQPDAEWTVEVPAYAKYTPIHYDYPLDKLDVPGVYAVKVTDEKTLQATTLVLGSDLDAIVKASRDQLLVFVQDMKSGGGRAGAKVLISDGEKVFFEGETGDDGVLLADWTDPRSAGGALDYLVKDGDHVAGSGLGLPSEVAQGLSARAYLDTDRPAYRPGDSVAVRGVVREVEAGKYVDPSGVEYRFEVFDSRGRRLLERPVTLSDYGTFHARFDVESSAPVGTYTLRLHRPGKSDFSGSFEVQSYQLQKVEVELDLPRTVYFRGETVEGDAIARYQYGTALADRPIEIGLPDGRTLTGRTDDLGKFHFEFSTEGFAEEQALPIYARLPEENVATSAAARLAVRAFDIALETVRTVYLDGESFALKVHTTDALGEPIGQTLKANVLKYVEQHGRTTERAVSSQSVQTDPKTGRAEVSIAVDDQAGGRFVVRVTGTDRFGNPVVADLGLTISGTEDAEKLRLLADRLEFKAGEPAKVTLYNRAGAGPSLLTWEADRILRYQVIQVTEGDNPIEWEADGDQFPNFTLAAARMTGTDFYKARIDLRVTRALNVEIKPTSESVGPGDSVEVEVTTKDGLGKPVAAEVSLALVDEALLRLYGDRLPPIAQFFYNQSRTGTFATEATNTFAYHPPTQPVSQALVEENEQIVALGVDRMRRGAVVDERQAGQSALAENMAMARKPAAAMEPQLMGIEYARRAAPAPADMTPDRQDPRAGADAAIMDADAGPFGYAAGAYRTNGGLVPNGRSNLSYFAINPARDHAMGRPVQLEAKSKMEAVSPRQQFVETAYWNPSIVTGADGKATVKFDAPSALSRYRFSAKGVTSSETLVGGATSGLTVRQDFFVDLKVPAILAEGDKPEFAIDLHHKGVKGVVKVVMTLYAGGREETRPKTVEIQGEGEGITTVRFEPFEVPAGDQLRLTVAAESGETRDELTLNVPIRPWGVRAVATASGSSNDDRTEFVELPAGRRYENPEMLVTLSPTLRRLVVELALGRDAYILPASFERCIFPPPPTTTADRASDLLAATAALKYLRAVGGAQAPEASRLDERARGIVAELLTSQNDDGGWPWVVGTPERPAASDRLTTTRALWALAEAKEVGLAPEPRAIDTASTWLEAQFAQVDTADLDTRAAVLHALSTAGRASYESANSLNRRRADLTDSALAHLALTFGNLERPTLAAEVLGVLGPRAKSESVGPNVPPRKYWEGTNQNIWFRSADETTALAALAYAEARPGDPLLAPAIEWLLAHRVGTAWRPYKARGPALAALSAFYGKAGESDDSYRLVVTVNDEEIYRSVVEGATAGEAVRVPVNALKAAGPNRVHFDIEGRGTYGYAVELAGFTREFGPDQDQPDRVAGIHRRTYLAADPVFEGKTLPTGFSSIVDGDSFENLVSSVPLGGRAQVVIDAWATRRSGQQTWEWDYLVLEEYLPAGSTVVEGSIQSQATHYEQGDGVLRFYFAPEQWPGQIRYDLYGYLPGAYRALPAAIRSVYDPGNYQLSKVSDLRVLPPGVPSTDPYHPTPDELLARGRLLFEDGRLAEAAESLEALWDQYKLNPEPAKEVAQILLKTSIAANDPRKVVKYFEVLKEKAPEVVIPFDDIKVVGRSYAEIGEHERAYLVWGAVAESSYLEDARVGEVFRQRGQTLEGVGLLLDLWREYPGTASIRSDLFGLSQVLASLAGRAIEDPQIRRELADADVARSDLLAQEIRLIGAYLALAPTDPFADEASLALLGAYLDLEDFTTVVERAGRYAKIYPESKFQDSFQYSQTLGLFHLGQYDEAIRTAERIAKATYRDESGVEQPSPNKWQALYILGQIHDARHQPAEAVSYYEQVQDRFTEAASAVKSITRTALELPEVSVIRPAVDAVADDGRPAKGVGLRSIRPLDPEDEDDSIRLKYRNLGRVEVKVYAVDLMRLYLERRDLDAIAGIDLAGIKPTVETTVDLDGELGYDAKFRDLELPITKEGAYLVIARGEDRYATGIVLVTPLELEILEEAEAGRVRVRVLDARTGAFVPEVRVNVIGSDNPTFFSGETDLRGVFSAEGVRGEVTAVARLGGSQYAFYRGDDYVGTPPQPPAATQSADAPASPPNPPAEGMSLDQNLRDVNTSNQMLQLDRLNSRYNPTQAGKGVQVDKAANPQP